MLLGTDEMNVSGLLGWGAEYKADNSLSVDLQFPIIVANKTQLQLLIDKASRIVPF